MSRKIACNCLLNLIYLEKSCWWPGSNNDVSILSFVALSRLLCLLESWSSDLSSWFGFRKDSRSPSILSSLEFFRGSCWRFVDAKGKLSALRTLRHNLDVDPWRRRNSWNHKVSDVCSERIAIRMMFLTVFFFFLIELDFSRTIFHVVRHLV